MGHLSQDLSPDSESEELGLKESKGKETEICVAKIQMSMVFSTGGQEWVYTPKL